MDLPPPAALSGTTVRMERASMSPLTTTLTGVLILAAAVWIGGFVAITVVARAATATMPPRVRVDFFHALGRSYGVIGSVALSLAYGSGAALVHARPWDAVSTATVVVAACLVVTLAVGVVQARSMSRLRRRALDRADDPCLRAQVRRGAVRAGALRAAIGGLSLVLLALGIVLAG
jgi:uncharacterized membrane protein